MSEPGTWEHLLENAPDEEERNRIIKVREYLESIKKKRTRCPKCDPDYSKRDQPKNEASFECQDCGHKWEIN